MNYTFIYIIALIVLMFSIYNDWRNRSLYDKHLNEMLKLLHDVNETTIKYHEILVRSIEINDQLCSKFDELTRKK
jgi:hypothetical protein